MGGLRMSRKRAYPRNQYQRADDEKQEQRRKVESQKGKAKQTIWGFESFYEFKAYEEAERKQIEAECTAYREKHGLKPWKEETKTKSGQTRAGTAPPWSAEEKAK